MSRTLWLKRFMGLVAALALALMTALVVAAPPAHARVLTTSIKGVALDAQTSKGVAGVRVYAMERWYPWQEQFNDQDWALRAAAEAVTNKSGAYTLKFPFFIWANPEGADTGFDPQLSSLMVDTANGNFPDGVKTSDAFLQSTSLANITGRLVDRTVTRLPARPSRSTPWTSRNRS